MRFKEGDYVKVRSWKDMENEFGINDFGEIPCSWTFIDDMRHLCGQILYIDRVFESYYIIMESNKKCTCFSISDDMLELRTYSKEEFEQQESTR